MNRPVSDIDFYADEVILDPLAAYKEMRAVGPIVWLPAQNMWVVTGHAECVAALRQPDLFRSGEGLSLNPEVNALLRGNSLNSDGERHDRTRTITATPINRKNVQELEPFIREAAEGLAGRLVDARRFDAVSQLATYLPLTIVVELVGLADAGGERMLRWAAATFNLFDGFNERSRASFAELVGLQAYLSEYGVPEKLKEGGLARRIFDEGPKAGFDFDECAQLMRDYINPSLDTTISATGFAAYLFAENPDQWDLLRSDPTLAANAVEEVVRLSTPIRGFSRHVDRDCDLAGISMKAGERVFLAYAAANRDPAVFPDPDRFDITRNLRAHVGFGHGRHLCMGLHLARLEITSLLNAFIPRVRRWHLDGEPEVAMNNTIRAFARLPVRVEPV